MLKWEALLDTNRRKPGTSSSTATKDIRTEIEKDHDRILFSTPVRRLADKTQVFPLERIDSIRNRLTHSHEVSNLARSIGVNLVFHRNIALGVKDSQRNIPAMLAATGLAHDLGNPPFGHQGEQTIRKWFADHEDDLKDLENDAQKKDFLFFEGNAQTLRLVTRLQVVDGHYGLDLTYGTLAALMKYTVPSNEIVEDSPYPGKRKHGYFQSEQDIVTDVWKRTGLKKGLRHPLTYVMEACDDIAYSILDAEDAVKKGIVSFYDLMAYLEHYTNGDAFTSKIRIYAEKKNKEYRSNNLTPAELNDVSMQRFRALAIGEMIHAVAEAFIQYEKRLMDGDFEEDLISNSTAAEFCKALKQFDRLHAYRNLAVREVELKGYNVIQKIMDFLWTAIAKEQPKSINTTRQSPLSNYVLSRVSENYKRVAMDDNNKMNRRYRELQLMTDMVSGMTDSFAVDFCEEIQKYA